MDEIANKKKTFSQLSEIVIPDHLSRSTKLRGCTTCLIRLGGILLTGQSQYEEMQYAC